METQEKKNESTLSFEKQEDLDEAQDVPYGIRKVVLMKKLASKRDKILVITGIILLAWAKNWEGNVVYSANVGITSYFNSLNIASLISVVLYILDTVLLPMYAKLSDLIGRTEAFSIAIFFYVISGIVQAVAKNMDTLVGGQVIYALGLTGVGVLGHVLIADITSSANRGLFQAFYDFPAMINIWVAPIVGEALGSPTREDWRWTYAMISFCILVTSIPLLVGLFRLEHTVKQSGQLEPRKKSEPKPLIEKIKHVLVEIDIVGSLLLVGFLCMILLPLVLATSRWGGWNSSRTIGCLVAGAVSGILFAIWERKFATKPLVPLGKWDTPTPIAGVISCAMISVISASNWTYFITYLQISRRIGNQESTYIDRSYDAAFLISQVGAGYAMKYFKVYRPIVFIGMSLMMIGIGLMIPSRYPDSSTAFVVITQVIAGFGAGMIYVPILVAVQSSVPHQDIAVATSLFQIGGYIASSVGGSIAAAIWNGMLPSQLAAHVPGEYDPELILGTIDYINKLPDDQHAGAVIAYGNVQRILAIVALCLMVLAYFFFLFMRPLGLTDNDSHDDTVVDNDQKIDEEQTSPSNSKFNWRRILS